MNMFTAGQVERMNDALSSLLEVGADFPADSGVPDRLLTADAGDSEFVRFNQRVLGTSE